MADSEGAAGTPPRDAKLEVASASLHMAIGELNDLTSYSAVSRKRVEAVMVGLYETAEILEAEIARAGERPGQPPSDQSDELCEAAMHDSEWSVALHLCWLAKFFEEQADGVYTGEAAAMLRGCARVARLLADPDNAIAIPGRASDALRRAGATAPGASPELSEVRHLVDQQAEE